MKYIVILGDGMADEPIPALDGKTPLQAAQTPCMDSMAANGCCGRLDTVPQGMHPGSEIANLSLLGYDVLNEFEGRGSLEAASMGISIGEGEMAMRCNLICIENNRIKNHSAGHISTEEASELIAFLNEKLATEQVRFCPGISYRHLLLIKGGDKRLECTPPHDVPGQAFAEHLVKPVVPEARFTADLLNHFILKSQEYLLQHPVNRAREAAGKDMANSIWPWSPGYRPSMKTMPELYPIRNGSVISAVDLIKGIGVYAGLEFITVPGATGLFDTNYEGKAAAAVSELRRKDFVFLHVEASDEAGHEGDADLKIRTIEYLDHRLIRPIWEEVQSWDEEVSIAVLPDHPTYCRTKTHMADPVPFLIYRTKGRMPDGKQAFLPDSVKCFDEFSVSKGAYGTLEKDGFIRALFGLE